MSPVDTADNRFCSECGQSKPASELARFGDRLICLGCKDTYAQKLREGVAPVATQVYGGFWIRFVALLIDGIILFLFNAIVGKVIPGEGMAGVNPADVGAVMARVGFVWCISVAAHCIYETFFVGNMGATPGKMAVGLRIVRPDGSRVTYARAAGRYFARVLSEIILLIGCIMAAFDKQKRALHDMICDTRVVKVRG